MNISKKFFLIIILLFSFEAVTNAEIPYYLDFKFILNESVAGKKHKPNLKIN